MAMPLPLPVFTVDMLHDFPDDGNRYELVEGFLIVTPAPRPAHQIVATRLATRLEQYLVQSELAHAVNVGEIERAPGTHLEPDLLVFPGPVSVDTRWDDVGEWWLAVEVFSPSSRMYDRNYKRDAYLALGVREVWLVDLDAKEILVSRRGGPIDEPVRDVLQWHPTGMPAPGVIDLAALFAGLD